MKRASITYTKNNLSRVLGMVREGETVLVVDRKNPVARIEPVDRAELDADDQLAPLVAKGVVSPPAGSLDVASFLAADVSTAGTGVSAVEALLAEREEGR